MFQIFAQDEEIVSFGRPPDADNQVFAPIVSATCRAGIMTIKVETLLNFAGVVHSRDYRYGFTLIMNKNNFWSSAF